MLPFQNLEGQDINTLDLLSMLPGDNLYTLPQEMQEMNRVSPNLLQPPTPENILLPDQLASNQGHIYHIPSTGHHFGLVEEDSGHTPIVRLQAPPDAYEDTDSVGVISIECPSN